MKPTLTLFTALLLAPLAEAAVTAPNSIHPGQPWLDTEGDLINAHGFCILRHGDKYYWYGSHKTAGKTESENCEAGVHCYVGRDFLNWENARMALSKAAHGMSPEVAEAGKRDAARR